MMSAEEAREELHRASNVLTAYYDIQVDVGLRDAIVEHITEHDPRWLRNAPADPDRPRRASCEVPLRRVHPDGSSDKENDGDGDAWRKFKLSRAAVRERPQGSRPPPRQLDVLSARRSGLTAARDFARDSARQRRGRARFDVHEHDITHS